MAIVLKFKQGDSGTELDLQGGATGFQLSGGGWNPSVANPVHMGDPPPILETLHLLLSNTSHNNIATNMQSLHEMQVLADRYINDPTQENPVWLHAQLANETGQRRALVRNISVQFKTSWFGNEATALDIPLVITVEREPYWESTSARDLPDYAQASGTAIATYNYTAAGDVVTAHDIVGDVGARVRYWLMEGTADIRQFWMGIRSANKHGASGLTNFEPIWELEDGTNSTDVTDSVDANASGGNRITVSESAVNWDDGSFHDVCYILLSDVTANYGDNIGNFLWFIRGECGGSSTTWEVRAIFHYSLGTVQANPIISDIVEITANIEYEVWPLGLSPIGHRNNHAILSGDVSYTQEQNFRVSIEARRTSGTQDLHLDCMMPIPVDEGFCFVKSNAVGTYHTSFGFSPEGTADVLTQTGSGPIVASGIIDPENFVLPLGDGRVYILAAEVNNISDLPAVTVNNGDAGEYYERWLSLRGSE